MTNCRDEQNSLEMFTVCRFFPFSPPLSPSTKSFGSFVSEPPPPSAEEKQRVVARIVGPEDKKTNEEKYFVLFTVSQIFLDKMFFLLLKVISLKTRKIIVNHDNKQRMFVLP